MKSIVDRINTVRYFCRRMTEDGVTDDMRQQYLKTINDKLNEIEAQSSVLNDVFRTMEPKS